jgi:hypothetical protein
VALLAVVFPIAFLAWPRVAVSLGVEGAYLAVAVFVWVVAQGGGGRPPSILGSVACLGLLLLEPVIIRLRPTAVKLTTWFNHNALGAVLASLPQFFIVVLCSRVAARFSSYLPAIIVIAFVYLLTILVGVVAAERAVHAEDERFDDIDDAPATPVSDTLDPWLEGSDDPWP